MIIPRAAVCDTEVAQFLFSDKSIPSDLLERLEGSLFSYWKKTIASGQTQYTHNKLSFQLRHHEEKVYLRITDLVTKQRFYHFLSDADKVIINKKLTETTPLYQANEVASKVNKLLRLTQHNGDSELKGLWGAFQLQTLDEVHYLYAQLVKTWREHRSNYPELSDRDYDLEFINTNQVFYNDEFGQAELNSIDGKPFVRIIHEKTEKSFIFLKSHKFDLESEHFKQYVSRQHISSGSSRLDGQYGRDVILFHVDKYETMQAPRKLLDPDRYNELKRFKPYTKDWWKEYWLAIKKRPSFSTFKFGLVCGIAQGTLALTSGAILDSIVGLDFAIWKPAMVATLWGTGFGMIASTFKNWVNLGPHWRRTAKNMLNGVLFQYLLTFVIISDPMTTLNPLTVSGMFNHFVIFLASYISNLAKPNWYNFAIIREKTGMGRGAFKIGKFTTEWSKNNVEHQIAYMPAFLMRLLERTNLGMPRHIPVGTGVLVGSIFLSEYLFMKYADYIANLTKSPDAIKMATFAKHQWQVKKDLLSDKEIVKVLYERFFSFDKKTRLKAYKTLRKKYPTLFKRHQKEEVISSKNIKQFSIPKKCISKISSLAS